MSRSFNGDIFWLSYPDYYNIQFISFRIRTGLAPRISDCQKSCDYWENGRASFHVEPNTWNWPNYPQSLST